MKANQTLTQIAQILGWSYSTISREVKRGRGHRGYQAEQACMKATERAQGSRNTRRIPSSWVWPKVALYQGSKCRPEQTAHELPLSHESVYLDVCAGKAKGGRLHKDFRSQKPRRRRCLSGHDRCGQISNRRKNGEHPTHIEARKQVDQALGMQTYFADTYCNWQRSSNEKFNGLLRQYNPKKRHVDTVT